MARGFVITGILCGLGSAGWAQTPACGFTGPTIFPELEAAEAAFVAGDYPGFFALAGAMMPNVDGTALMAGISDAVPGGFVSCTTIIQREDVGGFVQEVTIFDLPDQKGPISLYLQSAFVNGERQVMQFSFDSALGPVLEKLR